MGFGKNFAKSCLIMAGTYFALDIISWAMFGIGKYLDDIRFRSDMLGVMVSPVETFYDGVDEALRGFKWFGTGIINGFKKE